MEATAPPIVPWWYFAVTALAMTACLFVLKTYGYPWSVQMLSLMLVLGGFMIAVRRLQLK